MSKWPKVALDDICELVGGGTPSRQVPEYFGGDIPWITPTDVTKLNGRYLRTGRESITEKGLAKSSAKLLPPNSVLLTSRATIGFTAINTVPVSTNQGFANFICGERILPEYLAHMLEWMRDDLISQASGATFKEISKSTLKRINIPLPPIGEQRRIVEQLDRAADIRKRAEAARDKAGAIIPALFVDMFGDPATNPMGWDVVELREVLSSKLCYGSMVSPKAEATEWLDIRVANIKKGQIDHSDKRFVRLEDKDIARHSLIDGDIVMARAIGSEKHLGKCAIAFPNGKKWAFDSHIMRIRPNQDKIDSYWLHTFLNTEGGKRRLLVRSRASAIQHNINTKEVAAVEIPLPGIELQNRFSLIASELAFKIARFQKALKLAEATQTALSAEVFG